MAESGGTPPDAPPDPSTAEAARQPDGSPEAPGSLPTRGPIPYDRHQAVLTTTRRSVREEAEREFRDKYGWVDNYQKADVDAGTKLLAWLKNDPPGLIRFLQGQIEGSASAAPAAAQDPEPEPDIPLDDGRAVYSADQLRKWQSWNAKQFQQQIEQTYGPIRDRIALQDLRYQAEQEAGQTLQDCRTSWPMFRDLEKDIKARMLADQSLSLHTAYIYSMRDVGLTHQRAQWDAERSGQLTRKAAASTIQPGAARPSTPRPDSELTSREIVQQEWRRAAG